MGGVLCYARQEERGATVHFWVADPGGKTFHPVDTEPNVDGWEPVSEWQPPA